jgi:Bacterial SH3 domain/LysM domain
MSMLEGLGPASTAAPPPPPPPKKPSGAASSGSRFDAAIADAKSVTPQTGKSAPLSQTGKAAPLSQTGKAGTPSQSDSTANLGGLINGLHGDGDYFTVSLQAGARIGIPVGPTVGPQAQYGYDVTVKQVGNGGNAQYQVTFNKDLMAGVNLQGGPEVNFGSGKLAAQAELVAGYEGNLISSGTVTMTFSSKQDLTRGLGALRQEAQAQTLRDAASLANPQVAIAKPTVPRRDVAALEHDGSNLLSDAENTAKDGLKVASDALPWRAGHLISDLGSFGSSLFHSADDGAKTARDATRTAWDTGSGELIHTLGDNVADIGNFVRNPLDQWQSGSAVDVPLGGPLGSFAARALDSDAAKAGPNAADLQFLKRHITGYSVTIGEQGRGRLEAALGLGVNVGDAQVLARAVGQPRLADNTQITIAETLPQNGKPGTVSVTFADKLNLDARGAAQLKASLKAATYKGMATQLYDPNIASATGSVTLTWNLSAPQGKQLADAGHSLPITDLISGSRLAHPDSLTTKVDLQGAAPIVRQNGHWVPSGSFSHETLADWSITTTYKDPTLALNALRGAGDAPFDAIPTLTSRSSTTRTQFHLYDQHGLPVQSELDASVDGAGAKVWLYQQATSDHMLGGVSQRPARPKPPVEPQPPAPPPPRQLVVLPHQGLNVRTGPSVHAGKLGAFTSGTFVETTGQTAVDAGGRGWVQVTGPDTDRQTVTGWVAAQYVTPHPQGGENATGRIDQTEEGQGYIAVTVRSGDTIDGIAARYGKDPTQAVVVNDGHIIDPNLIFPGDTVYLPSGAPAFE